MKINNQRLNQWLSGEIAAYNDGTPESIEMIKELCERTSGANKPGGMSSYYYCYKDDWRTSQSSPPVPPHHVSWFFEPENEPEQPKCSLDRDETARMILISMVGSRDLSTPPDVARTAVWLTDALINILNQK